MLFVGMVGPETYHCSRLVPLLALLRGRIGEMIGHTETGCIVEERVGHKAGCCIEVRGQRRRCVGRRGLDALLHNYIISISVYLLHISTYLPSRGS
jgi:hypothetical protein